MHTFIPKDEIWIAKGYNSDYQARCIIHEFTEFKKMNAIPYYQAHKHAQKQEFLHGEDESILRDKINKIKKYGISDLKNN